MNDTQITQITQPLSTAVLYKPGKFEYAAQQQGAQK